MGKKKEALAEFFTSSRSEYNKIYFYGACESLDEIKIYLASNLNIQSHKKP